MSEVEHEQEDASITLSSLIFMSCISSGSLSTPTVSLLVSLINLEGGTTLADAIA